MIESSERINSEEHDVDAILANAYGHNSNPGNEATPVERSAPEPVIPKEREYEFNARGQSIKIKDNDPRLTQWLSQGYDYAQSTNAFKQERESWDKSRQDWEKQWGTYREIDQFAKENPDWWSHVDQSFQQRLSTPSDVPPAVKSYLDQRFEPLAQDIPLVKQFLQKMQTEEIQKQQASEDAKLDESVKSIQTKYPNLDFAAKDESGLSLEKRILDHAVKNSIPTFRAAFLDYYHDSIEKQAEARGKESTMQELKKRQKLGLLDESSAPSKVEFSFANSANTKVKSWNDPRLSSESILKEFKFA